MTTTTNLALTLIEANQAQKEVTANAAFVALDAAIAESAEVEVADGTTAVAAATMRGAVHLLLVDGSPATSTAFTVELAAVKRMLAITNTTGYTATVACDGAATGAAEATIAAGATKLVYADGTQVYGVGS